jgi:hypothetical protein
LPFRFRLCVRAVTVVATVAAGTVTTAITATVATVATVTATPRQCGRATTSDQGQQMTPVRRHPITVFSFPHNACIVQLLLFKPTVDIEDPV